MFCYFTLKYSEFKPWKNYHSCAFISGSPRYQNYLGVTKMLGTVTSFFSNIADA